MDVPGRLGILSLTIVVSAITLGRPSLAGRIGFHDAAKMRLVVANPPGIIEEAVPIYINGELIHDHNHKAVEAYFQVPGTNSWPAVLADIVANTFYRPTYQKPNGGGGTFGTSLISAPAFRTNRRLQLVPNVNRADVTIDGRADYSNTLQYTYGSQVKGTTTREVRLPKANETKVQVASTFEAIRDIRLTDDPELQNSDRLRMMTVSSMYSDERHYDTNLLRFQTRSGNVDELRLDAETPRGTHLYERAIEVGSWIELIKQPGSEWSPDSPSIRIDLPEQNELRLGLQGFLSRSTLTTDDSLSVWLEWLDAPDTIQRGTAFGFEYTVTAVPPAISIPEPGAKLLLALGMLPFANRLRRHRNQVASS